MVKTCLEMNGTNICLAILGIDIWLAMFGIDIWLTIYIPHVCHFFTPKVRKFATKITSQQSSIIKYRVCRITHFVYNYTGAPLGWQCLRQIFDKRQKRLIISFPWKLKIEKIWTTINQEIDRKSLERSTICPLPPCWPYNAFDLP